MIAPVPPASYSNPAFPQALSEAQRRALAEDLQLFAQLQSEPVALGKLLQLRLSGFPDELTLNAQARDAEARVVLARALDDLSALPPEAQSRAADDLAADFAALYLLHTYRISPQESVWFDEENLAMQAPMFAVREHYQRFGLTNPDWRQRPDDHLCLQLQFVAHLLEQNEANAAAEFLDQHLLRWLERFALGAAQRCATPFYAALPMLCFAYVEQTRSLLAPANPTAPAAPDERQSA